MIADLATAQAGAVASWQLTARDLSPKMIRRRLQSGHLHLVHHGVYAVGHRCTTAEGRRWAAVLAGGPGAVLSHRSAAAVWELRADHRPREDVTPRAGRRRSRPGLAFHRASLAPADRTGRGGLPVTSLPRTLLDLAATLGPRDLLRTLEHADRLALLDTASLDALFARTTGHHGERHLRAALAQYDPRHHYTRSELERRALEVVDRHGLPRPELNTLIGPYTVDLFWPGAAVVVELDGWDTHRTRRSFEEDRARDRFLVRAGLRAIRVTWRQLHEDPTVGADLRALLVESRP